MPAALYDWSYEAGTFLSTGSGAHGRCHSTPPGPPEDWDGVYVPGPTEEEHTKNTDSLQFCVEVSWPAASRWMTHLERPLERGYAGPRHWMGSLIEEGRDVSGQMYRRNRYYDPQTGKFTQEDPIGLAGGLNAYGYADGDPVSFGDPYGLKARDNDCCSPQDWENVARRTGEKVSGVQPYLEAAYFAIVALFPGGGGTGAIDEGVKALAMGRNSRAALSAAGINLLRSTAEVGDLVATHGPTLSRRALDRLTADIAANGIKEPIRYITHKGRHYVVDGHHRLMAAQRLGIRRVPVERVALPFRGYETVGDLIHFTP